MNPLRNPNINYQKGWFFITFQVAHNKTVLGVIDGKKVVYNELGQMVAENLGKLGTIFRELYIDTAMVMPNHVHAVVKIESGDAKKDLAYFVGRFKSFTTNQYLKMVQAGTCVDIGPQLWQRNFYDNLVSAYDELQNVRNYTLQNPARWEDDRFGPVTTHAIGNTDLLSEGLVAFVASDTHDNWKAEKPHVRAVRELDGLPPIGREAPLVSTFTSFEEQGALSRRLAEKLPFVWIDPAGIKNPLPIRVQQACDEGWGLVVSPVPSGTGVNKARAVWCNRWVLKVAERVYVGTISKGGTLDTLMRARRPASTIEVAQRPASTIEVAQRPASTIKVVQRPASTIEVAQRPASTIKVVQRPASTIEVAQRPASTIEVARRPASTIEVAQRPVSTIEVAQRPASTIKVVQRPASTIEVAQRPASTIKVVQRPASTIEGVEAPTMKKGRESEI